jgi:RNA polymerase sigma-70 factor (ECF subfamily)
MTSFDPERLLAEGAFVRALARDLVAGAADADDLVQETWLRALVKPPQAGISPRAWLAGLVKNVSRERRRADERRDRRELRAASAASSSPPIANDDPAALAERFELVRRILSWVDELAEPQRTTLLRRYLDGLEPAEIARRDSIPDATVRSRIKRALDELRARLDSAHGGERANWMAALLPWTRHAAMVAAGTPAVAIGGLLVKGTLVGIVAAIALLVVTGVGVRVWWTRAHAVPPTARDASTRASRPGFPAPATAAASATAPKRSAENLAGVAAGTGGDPASASDSSSADSEWRLEGVLRGLDPAIPWTGKIRVRAKGRSLWNDDEPEFEAKLEHDGTFSASLPGLAPGPGQPKHWRALKIEVVDPAYVDAESLVDALDARGGSRAGPWTYHVAIDTRPSARVHGRVVDEAGRPVTGATVTWNRSTPDGDERGTETDAGGRYQLESAALGAAPFHCWGAQTRFDERVAFAPTALDELLPVTATVELRAGVDLLVPDLVMKRGLSITGEVIDAHGDPVPDAIVSAHPIQRALAPVKPLAAGGDVTFFSSETITAVSSSEPSPPFFTVERMTLGNEQGAFMLNGLSAGRWNLRVVGRRGVPSHPVVQNDSDFGAIEAAAPGSDLRIVCRLCRVEVRAELDGQPLPAAPFTLTGFSRDRSGGSDLGGKTDSEGRFVFLALPGCRYQAWFDGSQVESETPLFALAEDETERIVTLQLEHRRPRVALAVKLRDPAGDVVGRAWFRITPISPPDAIWGEFVLDSDDSTFLLKELELGAYHVLVRAGAGSFGSGGFFQEEAFDAVLTEPLNAKDPANGRADRSSERPIEWTVELRRTGRLRIASRDRDGKSVGTHCTIFTLDGQHLDASYVGETSNSAMSSPDGTLGEPAFVTPPPPPGRYRVDFTAPGFVPQTVEAEVKPGETTDVVVTMPRR